MNKIETNINYEAVIFPTAEGWDKIKDILTTRCENVKHLDLDYDKMLNARKCRIGDRIGFKEQLWVIASYYNGIFFNGSPYLVDSKIIIFNED